MSDFDRQTVGKEARLTVPRRVWTPEEERREEMLRRYLAAVAAAAASQAAAPEPVPDEGTRPIHEREAATPRRPPAPRVRQVMTVPAVSVRGDTPFLDVAHTLCHEHVSAVPVVDAEDHVIGVVSESDLLAKAAVMSTPHRPGPLARLREHRLYEKSRGETAATLMTYPAITVHPGDLVTDAAWSAARSRLKRLPTIWAGWWAS
ncbi:CBS domain-containing protein [Streptomyces sp. NPDC001410]|uniref:CBS domain-containing protein n=1 Tax=Streptomyces sp. NPDC001410 TaxID=3364574 RepID=UPI00369363A3